MDLALHDRRVAAVIRRLQELPGQHLFRYLDEDGEIGSIASHDVNDYLRDATAGDFTAKDFRTWTGTVLAAAELSRAGPATTEREARRRVVEALASVSGVLGNTPAVTRRSYVHPAVVDAYRAGRLTGYRRRDMLRVLR